MAKPLTWTPAHDALLRKHWPTGLSSARIAHRIGMTLGQVVRRSAELNLPKRAMMPFDPRGVAGRKTKLRGIAGGRS